MGSQNCVLVLCSFIRATSLTDSGEKRHYVVFSMIQNNAELIFYDYWEIDFIDILISEHVVFTTLVIIIKENN